MAKPGFSRTKMIATGIGIFSSLAVVSSGAAAFIVSASKAAAIEGNVNIASINDASLHFTDTGFDNSETDELFNTICFDANPDDNVGRFTYVDDDKGTWEHMSVSLSGYVAPGKYLGSITVRLEAYTSFDSGATPIQDAIADNYIQLKTWAPANASEEEKQEYNYLDHPVAIPFEDAPQDLYPDHKYFHFEIGFTWGSYFNYSNPSEYYDDENEGGGLHIDSDTALQQMARFDRVIHYGEQYASAIPESVGPEDEKPTLSFKVTITAEAKK